MTIKLEEWLPQEPNQGPPLPEFLNIYWPWYKPPVTPGAELAIGLGDADPNALVENTHYVATVTVTNKSTKRGVASPATLSVRTSSQLGGAVLQTDITQSGNFPAGGSLSFSYPFDIPPDAGGKTGNISAVVLDPSMKQIAQGSLPIAVQVRVVTVEVGPGYIWYEPLTTWEPLVSGRQVPVGADITLSPSWKNTSSVSIVGHIDVLALRPDGTSGYLTVSQGQDISAVPGSELHAILTPFNTTQDGTYTITVTLSSGGVVLKAITFTLVAVAEVVYGADVVISV